MTGLGQRRDPLKPETRTDQLAKGGMVGAGDDRSPAVEILIRHQAKTDDRNVGSMRAPEHRRPQLHGGSQGEGRVLPGRIKFFQGRAAQDDRRMDPQKIGLQRQGRCQ